MNFTPQQLKQADELVGKKQKVYYPNEQKFLKRIVRKDERGYFIKYQWKKAACRPMLNSLGDVIGFEALKYGGR